MADEPEMAEYREWVQRQPCACCGAPPPSVMHHHTGKRGKGQRAHDRWGMPLAVHCHNNFHTMSDKFRMMNKAGRTRWQNRWVLQTWNRWIEQGGDLDVVLFGRPQVTHDENEVF